MRGHPCLFIVLLGITASAIAQNYIWSEREVASGISHHQRRHQIIGDQAGGLIIVWAEEIFSGGNVDYRLKGERLTADGNPAWSPGGGINLVDHLDGDNVTLIPDGSGGTYIAWTQTQGNKGVFVQRRNADSTKVWQDVEVFDTAVDFTDPVRLASDGAGGVLVAYRNRVAQVMQNGIIGSPGVNGLEVVPISDFLNGTIKMVKSGPSWFFAYVNGTNGNMYIKRLDTGILSAPILAANAPYASMPEMIADGQSGVILAWRGTATGFPLVTKYLVQRFNSAGTMLWDIDGEVVADSSLLGGDPFAWYSYANEIVIASDDAGGAYIAWLDGRRTTASSDTDMDPYAVRISNTGHFLWSGVLLPPFVVGSEAPGSQNLLAIEKDYSGNALVTFTDRGGFSDDITLVRVHQEGDVIWKESVKFDSYSPQDPGVDQDSPEILAVPAAANTTDCFVVYNDPETYSHDGIFATRLQIDNTPENDVCQNAVPVTEGVYEFSTILANSNGNETNCNDFAFAGIDRDIWFKYYPTCNGDTVFSLCGSDFDTKIALYQACSSGLNSDVACNDDSQTCNLQSEIAFTVHKSQSYLIRVGGFRGGAGGNGRLMIYHSGDVNQDCDVNLLDIQQCSTSYLASESLPAFDELCDFDGSEIVDLDDILKIVTHWLDVY